MAAPRKPLEKAGSVLVVEDENFTRRMYQANLEKAGWRVVVASGVDEAKELVQRSGAACFDCVVSDYSLGGATGIDFLHWIKNLDSGLAVILITAGMEKELVEASLRGGACDFLNKPVGGGHLVESVTRAAGQTFRQRKLRATQQAAESVGGVQRRLLASAPEFAGIRTEICFCPKHEAGGDFMIRHQQGGRFFHFITTDASGHDLKSAFVSAYFQGMVRGMMESATPVLGMFSAFNSYLCREWNSSPSEGIISLAASCVTIDVEKREAIILTCGNPAPVYVDGEGDVHLPGAGAGCAPLGWFDEISVEPVGCPVGKGGAFFSWSDGLEDLASSLEVSPLSLASALLAAWREGKTHPVLADADDDVMVARIELGPQIRASSCHWPVLAESHLGSDAHLVDEWQKGWGRSLLMAIPSLSEDSLFKILLCTREALLNALKHGCSQGESARIQIVLNADSSVLKLTVSDPGRGHAFDFDSHGAHAAEDLIEEHRGLLFMRHLADEMRLERNGATVVLDFRLSAAS